MFVIAAGDIIKYQVGHMMRNADARTRVVPESRRLLL